MVGGGWYMLESGWGTGGVIFFYFLVCFCAAVNCSVVTGV